MGGVSFGYDGNGNRVSRSEGTATVGYSYDAENRLTVVSNSADPDDTSFTYDAGGARIKRAHGDDATYYIGAIEIETNQGDVTETHSIYSLGGGVTAVRVVTSAGDDGEVTFTFGDHLGSSSTIWQAGELGDTDPGVTSYQRYYPYGEPRDDYNPALPTDRTFTGQITDGLLDDGGTGLMYYRARYYDPQVGRFAAADTIVPNPGNPQDLNRYTYVGNNPVNGTDPSGHAFIEGLDFSGSYYYWPSLGFLVDSPPPVTDTVTGEVLASANDAMTVSTANALFDDMADEKDILYDYAWDYCFIRNKQMATRIAERGEASFSVFILGSSELSLRTTVREGLSYPGVPQYDPDKNGEADQVWWNWHVARGVYVSTGRGETPDIYVIDPSLFRSKKAVPLQDWIDAMGDPNATVYYRDDDAYGMLLTWNASEAEWIIDDWTEPPEAFPRDSWNAAADECFAAWGCAGVRNVREPGWSWSSY